MSLDTNYYNKSIEETINITETSKSGITKKQAQIRFVKNGANELEAVNSNTFLKILLAQLKNFMLYVLAAAAIVSLILGETADSIIIFAVILLNVFLGAIQESKAEKALEALKKMSAPYAKIRREGKVLTVKASKLVIGDIVILGAGDFVPADLRLIQTASLMIEESALTGESAPVQKNADTLLNDKTVLGDRFNMAYSGTSITYGRGEGIVCYTGMNTQMGRIAGALKAAKKQATPLQKRMNQLSRILSIAVIAIAVVVFVAGILQGREYLDMFLTAVSLAVAAIPEGLAAVVTVVLTMGVQKMSKRGAIIRKLPAVETLGCTGVICSDKTGTLTQNKMTVLKAYVNEKLFDADNLKKSRESNLLLNCMTLCNDSKSSVVDDKVLFLGDPTETALVSFSKIHNLDLDKTNELYPRLDELPFDSDRKLMSTVNSFKGFSTVFTKGALDELLVVCTHIEINGKILELNDIHKKSILDINKKLGKSALRVLGFAYKQTDKIDNNQIENNLIFIGLTGMMDPPREEAKDAVSICKRAGMKVVMITGDHKITAMAIAKKIGIFSDGDKVLTGAQLSEISDDELENQVKNISVYARVSPVHKVRIVKAWKNQGEVVAMTGDGVNDAPALKSADIGVGMGITGTEVSKNASDMILTDDNFSTIVKAVHEGRRIYANIKKAVQFLLSANLSEVLTLLIGTFMGHLILYPVQILWVNLVTDTFPSLALGMEEAPMGIMDEPPRKANESFFSKGLTSHMIIFGVVLSAITLGIYFIGLNMFDSAVAITMAFLTLGLAQLFHAFNVRSNTQSVVNGFFKNKYMHMAFLLSAVLQIGVVLVTPLNRFFHVVPLSSAQWLYVAIASFAVIPASEIIKLIKKAAAMLIKK